MTLRRAGYACWLLAVAILYFFENNTGTRAVLLSSILVPVFSVLCAAWTAKKAFCRLTVPESAEKGKTAVCKCAFSGPWTKIGCVLSCRVRSTHWMTHETSEWAAEGEEAFSIDCARMDPDTIDFSSVERILPRIAELIRKHPLPRQTILNVGLFHLGLRLKVCQYFSI